MPLRSSWPLAPLRMDNARPPSTVPCWASRIRSDDAFAIVLNANGVELRLQKVERFTPQPFTALGWQVADVAQVLARLAAANVRPERYAWLDRDPAGIWQAPSGARVAWFHDPDGGSLVCGPISSWLTNAEADEELRIARGSAPRLL